jgi:hypothetical protein
MRAATVTSSAADALVFMRRAPVRPAAGAQGTWSLEGSGTEARGERG